MSIEYEINRISTNVRDTLSAIAEMGGAVPDGATSNNMAASVRSIPVGAKIDDTISSTTTTYSSSKIEEVVTNLNEANAAQNTEINKKANNADLAKVAKSGSYDDLTAKPTIPTVPTTLPNPNALTFTGAVNDTYDGSAAKSVAIPVVPEALKNPNKLILSGAVTAEYDGSTEVSVDIPAGSVKTVAGVSPDAAGNVALTAENVGAMQWSLLWENASPTSAFAEQVLPYTYTWKGYDMLMIVYVYDVTTTERAEYKLAQIVECASGMKSYLQMYSVSGGLMFARAIYLNGNGAIDLSGAQKRAFSSITKVTDDNKGCIPLRIYGAKGVQKS